MGSLFDWKVPDLSHSSRGAWKVVQIANQFTGKNIQKKLEAIGENLDRLQWFGVVIEKRQASHTGNMPSYNKLLRGFMSSLIAAF
jgi:hypothetical protein